jgi:hypothetical protein
MKKKRSEMSLFFHMLAGFTTVYMMRRVGRTVMKEPVELMRLGW